MKKWMLCAAFVTAAAPFAAVAEEGEEKKDAESAEVTLTGEVVELSCYVKGQRGEEHIDCALQCLDNGLPVAFVVTEEDKEQLYFVLFEDGTAPVDMLYDYVGTEVDLTGKVLDKGGAKVIVATEVVGSDDWLTSGQVGSASTQ